MADSKVSEALLKRGTHLPGVRQPDQRPEGRVRFSGGMDEKDFGTWRIAKKHYKHFGLELFSGSGHFSAAMRKRQKDVFCVEFDICHGPQFDLTSRKVQQRILELLVSGKVAYVWMGTPCNSWSRARRWDGRGPGPLRDDKDFLTGYPWLPPKDLEKIRVGNCLMRFTAKVFRVCLQHHIPVALENPNTSRLWLARPIQHLLHHAQVEHGYTDFCQDHRPYRKRTRLMWANVQLRYALRQCRGPRGLCSATRQRHVQLEGVRDGQFMTLWAQPYPKELCTRLATAFTNHRLAQTAAVLWPKFGGL